MELGDILKKYAVPEPSIVSKLPKGGIMLDFVGHADMTILGKTMIGVGSARADKGDYLKELIGDFLRNASMRFGICLSLWTKSEWEDLGGSQKPAGGSAITRTTQSATSLSGDSPSDAQLRMIRALGHSDAMPTTKAAASTLITALKNKVTASDEGAF